MKNPSRRFSLGLKGNLSAAAVTSVTSLNPRMIGWRQTLARINAQERRLGELSDRQLRRESLSLRYRARSGESPRRLLHEAFALVREAAVRSLKMRHYDVQILGGVAIFDGSIAEMQTGEGKTLTATLPMYLAALSGRGAHLATANDYLAARNARLTRPVYELLGLTVGVVEASTPRPQRRRAYACDVTYGTAKEFGFDFLRDRLLDRRDELAGRDALGGMLGLTSQTEDSGPVQRGHHFALVDEADSILIDEARTPLIVSSLPGEDRSIRETLYRWGAEVATRFSDPPHYEMEPKNRVVQLTREGRRLARELNKPVELERVEMFDIYQQLERAIQVEQDYVRDRQYVVREGEIVIVDEFTGRLAEGRKWREGIHQAVEAKDGLRISVEAGEAARVTVQDYFLRYDQLGGMTGTAWSSRRELRKIYKLRVAAIPTNRPPRRVRLPDAVFANSQEKWRAVVDEVRQQIEFGRPVLIGTRSIDKSETLSKLLTEAGVEHQVLNASRLDNEAEIVARAGQRGRVTVATNMAGRGTDVTLGEGVSELGGMHVICTELHESPRIDRQLIGRCGRQGDPGSFRHFLALDDEILRLGLGARRAARLAASSGRLQRFAKWFRVAQARVEQKHFRQRRLLLNSEKRRRQLQQQMGQDPYLDTAAH